jgi:hypothetical protein
MDTLFNDGIGLVYIKMSLKRFELLGGACCTDGEREMHTRKKHTWKT